MSFNKCIVIIIFCIIVALLENQLEQGRSVVGKIDSKNSFKVISVVCGRNDGDFNKMDYFWISSMINIIFSSRQSQCSYFLRQSFKKLNIKEIQFSSLNVKKKKKTLKYKPDTTSCYLFLMIHGKMCVSKQSKYASLINQVGVLMQRDNLTITPRIYHQ